MTVRAHRSRMSREEIRASFSLGSIFGLRMMGLFLILPVFAMHAPDLRGGDSLTLVGLAMGAYGLTQAILQIPYGIAADRYGRKRVIAFGLLLFAAGSFLAAASQDIWLTIFARCVQGAGAISAAVMALAADLTREEHRTKTMAVIGASIGLVFALSLVAAPALYRWVGMAGIFALTGVLAVAAIGVVYQVVPPEPGLKSRAGADLSEASLARILGERELARLYLGTFVLSFAQMSMFVVFPRALTNEGGIPVDDHWKVYLPVVLASFVLMLPPILSAERKGKAKRVFIGSIVLIAAVQLVLAFGTHTLLLLVGALLAFFVGFNVLEASIPSLVSRIAPAGAKATALGVYNTTLSLGLFAGGAVGGWLAQHYGALALFLANALLMFVWTGAAASMRVPPPVSSRTLSLPDRFDPVALRDALLRLTGVRDATIVPEEGVAHLKVMPGWDEAGALRLLQPQG
jgi:MFS family permease